MYNSVTRSINQTNCRIPATTQAKYYLLFINEQSSLQQFNILITIINTIHQINIYKSNRIKYTKYISIR